MRFYVVCFTSNAFKCTYHSHGHQGHAVRDFLNHTRAYLIIQLNCMCNNDEKNACTLSCLVPHLLLIFNSKRHCAGVLLMALILHLPLMHLSHMYLHEQGCSFQNLFDYYNINKQVITSLDDKTLCLNDSHLVLLFTFYSFTKQP